MEGQTDLHGSLESAEAPYDSRGPRNMPAKFWSCPTEGFYGSDRALLVQLRYLGAQEASLVIKDGQAHRHELEVGGDIATQKSILYMQRPDRLNV